MIMNKIKSYANGLMANFEVDFNLSNIEYGTGSIYEFLTFSKKGIHRATMIIPFMIDARVARYVFEKYSGANSICIKRSDINTRFMDVAGLDMENITLSVDKVGVMTLLMGTRDKDIRARMINLFSDSILFRNHATIC